MKERVHIHTLEVTGQGQIINFQVRIPRDAQRIVGILITENALASTFAPSVAAPLVAMVAPDIVPAFAVPAPRITFPVNVGSVLLQSKNKANFFYQEDVLHNENSYTVGDFSQAGGALPLAGPSARGIALVARPANFRGGANYKEVCIEIDVQNTKLFGMYTDVINEQRGADSPYQVKLYFYYQQKRIISNEN